MHGLLIHTANSLKPELHCWAELMPACAYCIQNWSNTQCTYMHCWHSIPAAQEPATLNPPWAACIRLLVSTLHGLGTQQQPALSAAHGVPAAHSRDLSCLQVGTYALFVGEVYAWYCVGEIVGRGFSVAGYNV